MRKPLAPCAVYIRAAALPRPFIRPSIAALPRKLARPSIFAILCKLVRPFAVRILRTAAAPGAADVPDRIPAVIRGVEQTIRFPGGAALALRHLHALGHGENQQQADIAHAERIAVDQLQLADKVAVPVTQPRARVPAHETRFRQLKIGVAAAHRGVPDADVGAAGRADRPLADDRIAHSPPGLTLALDDYDLAAYLVIGDSRRSRAARRLSIHAPRQARQTIHSISAANT